jgi:serine/threonine protein kinase
MSAVPMPSHPPSATAPFPEKVGRYELLLPIGTGGMATVFLARHSGVGGFARDVALKLVHSHLRSDEESKMHLLEEAKLSARVRHPNVVSVQEVGEDPFGLYLVMDYVEGDNLSGLERAARKANKPLTDRLIARLLNDALLGLHAAHELCDEEGAPLGIVHRDFTPQNILVSIEGITRLTDFGVAKAADRAVRTKTGLIKGKIAYMAPEQARGLKLDRRCDVWAAGVVAWELCARRRLYTSEDEVATLLRIVTERPQQLSDVLPDVSPELNKAITWALEPDAEQRCPTAEAFRQALEAAWTKHGGMADVAELAAFVRDCIGNKLIERQASISEMRSLRLRIEEIARTAPDTSDSDPTNDYPAYRTPPHQWEVPAPVSGHSATVPSLPAHLLSKGESAPGGQLTRAHSRVVVAASDPSASNFGPEPSTETSAVLPAFVDRRPARLLWIGGSVAAAAVIFLVASWNSDRSRGDQELTAHGDALGRDAARSEPIKNVSSAPAVTTGVPTTRAEDLKDVAEQSEPTTTPTPSPATSDSVDKAPKKGRATRAKPAASRAEPPRVTKPGLASSPYGAQK